MPLHDMTPRGSNGMVWDHARNGTQAPDKYNTSSCADETNEWIFLPREKGGRHGLLSVSSSISLFLAERELIVDQFARFTWEALCEVELPCIMRNVGKGSALRNSMLKLTDPVFGGSKHWEIHG